MFYEKLKQICKEKQITLVNLMGELGLSTSNLSYWKNGRMPKLNIITMIADYFQVPLSYFTADDGFSDEDKLKFALFGDTENITDEMFDDVKRYAEFVKEKYKNDNT
jgi:transcriptional regulator with XRE-family HTH domain